jgi:hypothetical protein
VKTVRVLVLWIICLVLLSLALGTSWGKLLALAATLIALGFLARHVRKTAVVGLWIYATLVGLAFIDYLALSLYHNGHYRVVAQSIPVNLTTLSAEGSSVASLDRDSTELILDEGWNYYPLNWSTLSVGRKMPIPEHREWQEFHQASDSIVHPEFRGIKLPAITLGGLLTGNLRPVLVWLHTGKLQLVEGYGEERRVLLERSVVNSQDAAPHQYLILEDRHRLYVAFKHEEDGCSKLWVFRRRS